MEIDGVEVRVVDNDTHVVEPADLWSARLPAKYLDRAPSVRWDELTAKDWWYMDGMPLIPHALPAHTNWNDYAPEHPPTWQDADPVTYDASARLKRMSDDGIDAQVLFPNLALFSGARLMKLADQQFQNSLIMTFNDWQAEWSSPAPDRLLGMASLPFWDLDASLREVERCSAFGFRGAVMSLNPAAYGLPQLSDPHWDPLWATLQERGWPVLFHVGTGNAGNLDFQETSHMGRHTHFANRSVSLVNGNISTIAELIFGGVCHRFPSLNFVSVESGVGYLPALLELMDWQFLSCGVHKEHPEYELLPNEYFKRQIYGCFWFERAALLKAIEQLGADNFLFETDFPHQTSQTSGPATPGVGPRRYVSETFADVGIVDIQKVLHENADRLYRLAGS